MPPYLSFKKPWPVSFPPNLFPPPPLTPPPMPFTTPPQPPSLPPSQDPFPMHSWAPMILTKEDKHAIYYGDHHYMHTPLISANLPPLTVLTSIKSTMCAYVSITVFFMNIAHSNFQLGDASTIKLAVVATKFIHGILKNCNGIHSSHVQIDHLIHFTYTYSGEYPPINSQVTSNKSNKHVANHNGGFKVFIVFLIRHNAVFFIHKWSFSNTMMEDSPYQQSYGNVCWVIILPEGAANPCGTHMDRATSTAWCLCV